MVSQVQAQNQSQRSGVSPPHQVYAIKIKGSHKSPNQSLIFWIYYILSDSVRLIDNAVILIIIY